MSRFELTDFAPADSDFYLDAPEPAFAQLRKHDPIHWYEGGGGFWCVTRHADVREVSRHPKRFCSGRGTQIFQIELSKTGQSLAGKGSSFNMPPAILQMDPPAHNRHRKLVMDQFTPRMAASMEDRVRATARESLANLPMNETVDFVESVAVPLPMFVIADLLGVAREDRPHFRRWSDALIEAGGGGFGENTIASFGEMFEYLGAALQQRRTEPSDDLLSTLLHAKIDGETLSESEVLMFAITLLVAGNETTRNLISGGTRALLERPDQLAKLVDRPQLLPNAIEEMLRYVSPVRSFARCATEDLRLGDKSIAKDDFLVLFYGSANRDESVFGDESEVFDIGRANAKQHLAFGSGEHLCLGASLARLEARVLFEELMPRLPKLRMNGEPRLLASVLMNSVAEMPVIFGA